MRTFGLLGVPGNLGLATDLYQLTMAAGYFENGMGHEPCTFELFVRRLPERRGYLIAAGLEQVVEYLQNLHFSASAITYLRRLPQFAAVGDGFWEYLRTFRFTGDLNAIPEGTVVFPDEPLVQVSAPLLEAQLVETFLLATLNHQTLIATKAARVVDAAGGKAVIDFGARRAHGFDAAIYGARAAVIGGCVGTSNVLAGQAFGIDLYGTAAHSFTMAFQHELDAFRAFQHTFPEHAILLIDTYDTLRGAHRALDTGAPVQGVRIDSGDLLELSREVRRILDEGGQPRAIIVASGDLDEAKIAKLVDEGAPIDVFGVGTDLMTSRDAPALGGVYKLVEIEEDGRRRAVRKLSEGKATYPEVKQVYRSTEPDGRFTHDELALATEERPGAPLLEPVLRRAELVGPLPRLAAIRDRAAEQRAALPGEVRRLDDPGGYPVEISPGIRRVIKEMDVGG